jgi:hypothetical protein
MVYVRYLDSGACGYAETDDDFSSVAHEEFGSGGSCDSIVDTTMEEFGHNGFDWIEPHGEQSAGGDWCDDASYPDQYRTHDRYDDYAIECGVFHNLDDFHDNRWTEYLEPVASPDGNETGDNNGDLNNGIE